MSKFDGGDVVGALEDVNFVNTCFNDPFATPGAI